MSGCSCVYVEVLQDSPVPRHEIQRAGIIPGLAQGPVFCDTPCPSTLETVFQPH